MFVFFPPPRKNVHERVDPAAVRAEVELLQRLCHEGETRALKSVRYTSGLNYLPRSTGRQGKHLRLATFRLLFNRKWVKCSSRLIIVVTLSSSQSKDNSSVACFTVWPWASPSATLLLLTKRMQCWNAFFFLIYSDRLWIFKRPWCPTGKTATCGCV